MFIRGHGGTNLLCAVPTRQMAAVMNTLFPSMTVENVLKSQVAELAKLQLSRMIENGPKNIYPQSTVV